jgi:non-homologous end joining protein Ku
VSREMNKVAIGRVVLTNREHIISLEPLDKGLMGTLLRYPYEVRSEGPFHGTLKLRNLSFLGSDQMDNLLKDHT